MIKRIVSVEYIRGLAMLGVIGIHTGSYMLSNPGANPELFALMEILSRFSVPIFFFVSAFSLFRQYPLDCTFDAGRFYRRRFVRVLLPFIAGSSLYMLHYSWTTGDWTIWFPILVYEFFFFGMASYQLYFLVILLWFYLLMPLWRLWVKQILSRPFVWLGLLFVLQIVFNYYSSYVLRPSFTGFYLNLAVQFRMSWWVVHYLFLFLLGGCFAVRYEGSMSLLRRHTGLLRASFLLTLAAMLCHYYFLLGFRHYTLEQAVNTVHQLSPAGVCYTLAACLYLMVRFDEPLPQWMKKLLQTAGRYSYGIFWIHPLFMHYFHKGLQSLGWKMDVPVTLVFYAATTLCSLGAAVAAERLSKLFRPRAEGS